MTCRRRWRCESDRRMPRSRRGHNAIKLVMRRALAEWVPPLVATVDRAAGTATVGGATYELRVVCWMQPLAPVRGPRVPCSWDVVPVGAPPGRAAAIGDVHSDAAGLRRPWWIRKSGRRSVRRHREAVVRAVAAAWRASEVCCG